MVTWAATCPKGGHCSSLPQEVFRLLGKGCQSDFDRIFTFIYLFAILSYLGGGVLASYLAVLSSAVGAVDS